MITRLFSRIFFTPSRGNASGYGVWFGTGGIDTSFRSMRMAWPDMPYTAPFGTKNAVVLTRSMTTRSWLRPSVGAALPAAEFTSRTVTRLLSMSGVASWSGAGNAGGARNRAKINVIMREIVLDWPGLVCGCVETAAAHPLLTKALPSTHLTPPVAEEHLK